LHFEICVVNMVLDNFYEFIDDQVEVLMTEEKVAWNNIITEAAAKEANERLEQWLSDNFHILSMLILRKSYMAADLRYWALPTATKERFLQRRINQNMRFQD
jgi:hypothetical protein